jgi:S1-C subfamily serine protease
VTDAPILSGNSGGPLLNMTGAVIGMMTTSDDGEPCCSFAIPSNTISHIVPTLIKFHKYEHPWIGLTPRTLPSISDEDIKGVSVYSIDEGGPAHEERLRGSTVNQFGKLQMGDMITAVDGRPITSADEFETYIDQNKSVGDGVELTIYRNGTTQQKTVILE